MSVLAQNNFQWPHRRFERWKYTDLKSYFGHVNFEAVHSGGPAQAVNISPENAISVIFINGQLANRDYESMLPAGLSITPLSEILGTAPERVAAYRKAHAIDDTLHPMVGINESLAKEGLWIECDKAVVLKHPIHIIYQAEHDSFGFHNLNHCIQMAESSKLSVIESVQSGDNRQLFNTVTSVSIGKGASLQHISLSMPDTQANHIAGLHLWQGQDSKSYSFNVSCGASLARYDTHAQLQSVGATAEFDGVSILSGSRHVDHHSIAEHQADHTVSREYYKMIADDKAHGVFNGKAIVNAGTHGVDVHQLSRNLLLSSKAAIDTKPELEIYSDDLKANHGATVGQLDANELFYLQSRGFSKQQAQAILTRAFLADVLLKVPDPSIKEWLEGLVADAMDVHFASHQGVQ